MITTNYPYAVFLLRFSIAWLILQIAPAHAVDIAPAVCNADDAIAGNDKAVADYKSGNGASINALMGSVMKASRGKANPPAVIAMLKKKLDA